MKQLTTTFFITIFIMSTTSCSSFSPYKVPIIQGNIWEEDDIEKIKVGLTKDQVEFIFGAAVIKDPFRDYRWDYFNSVQIGEKVMQENKLTIYFDNNGLVERWIIEKLSD
jgi:outer membrane protein assembly factor BamE